MKQTVRVQTPFGQVPIDVLQCDECAEQVHTKYAIGWLQLFRLAEVVTLRAVPEESHFCSAKCLNTFILHYV